MSGDPEPAGEAVGTLAVALMHAERLLAAQPALAAEQAAEILKSVPGHPGAQLLLGIARRRVGDLNGALAVLEPLARSQPGWFAAHYELGLAQGAARHGESAIVSLRRAVELKPDLGDAWRALAEHLNALGDTAGADFAYAQHLKFASRDPRLLEAGAALVENRIAQAEALLRAHLKQRPTDIAAIRMLAEVAARLGRFGDSEILLARCLELAPGFTAARHNYASILNRQGRAAEALAEIGRVLVQEPDNSGHRNLKAAILGRIGEYEQALAIYEGVLAEYPHQPKAWMSYGHALKSAGRREDSIDAYRRAIALLPGDGETWWSLANLKTFRFEVDDLATMRAQLARTDLTAADRFHFHFAIGKALEDAGDMGGFVCELQRRQPPAPSIDPLRCGREQRPNGQVQDLVFRILFRGPGRFRVRCPGSDLHRRPAAFGFDAARADPVQPLGGRRHDGAARRHFHGARS